MASPARPRGRHLRHPGRGRRRLHPHAGPAARLPGTDAGAPLASISLLVVFFNALSGSIAYARLRRIDYRSGLRFAAAGIPGSILGALAVHLVPTRIFDAITAAVLAILSVLVIRLRPHAERAIPRGATKVRELVDAHGELYRYQVPLGRGTLYSAGVGFLSSFLGIGG